MMAQRFWEKGSLGQLTALMMLVGSMAFGSAMIGCGKENVPAEKATQATFTTPEQAGDALFNAAKTNDRNGLLVIFGPNSGELLFSGDDVKDKDTLQNFVAGYAEMHRWREIKPGGEMLYTGVDNFIFPIPLGKNPSGQWYFDTAAGKDEILARRIGKDELAAIAACAAVADAQNEYFRNAKQYAQQFVSDNGKRNGLYWPATPGQPASPLEGVVDFAKAVGYGNAGEKPQPFVGYYFRILKQGGNAQGAKDYIVNGKMTGGFAVLAYPAEYRDSGIMTFVVGKDGVVYQKDLGEKTKESAEAMAAYNPTDGWVPAL